MALTTPFFRVKMQQINHYTIAKKGLHSLCLHGFSSIFHARFHRKNELNPVHSFYGLVHSFLRRCWFISKVLRLFCKIFAFFASYSAIIFDGLALGWYDDPINIYGSLLDFLHLKYSSSYRIFCCNERLRISDKYFP